MLEARRGKIAVNCISSDSEDELRRGSPAPLFQRRVSFALRSRDACEVAPAWVMRGAAQELWREQTL